MKDSSMDMGEMILQKLKERERSIAWLAKKINCDDGNLGRLLRTNKHIHSELLLRISIAMEEDFFAYYSEIVREKVKNCKFYSEKL